MINVPFIDKIAFPLTWNW